MKKILLSIRQIERVVLNVDANKASLNGAHQPKMCLLLNLEREYDNRNKVQHRR